MQLVLYVDRELTDYLTANEAWRRTLRLSLHTDALLRQGGGRLQARKQQRYLEDARGQIRDQMRKQGRRAFRGEVSVQLTMFASGRSEAPSAPKSVKRYLDAMSGLVYRDDRQIAHLEVQRFANDHPYKRGSLVTAEPTAFDALMEDQQGPWVSVSVAPIRIYAADYDRAFRLRDDHGFGRGHGRDAEEFWNDNDDPQDDHELDQLLEERDDDAQGRGLYGLCDEGMRTNFRHIREMQIDRLITKQILGRRPSAWDRPGPDPFAYLGAMAPSQQLVHGSRIQLPGEFWVSAPGGSSWEASVDTQMRAHRASWSMLPGAFDEPLSLDIATHGSAEGQRDVDNVANPILVLFEELYCGDRRGTVTAYRTYRMAGVSPGVRVQVMPGGRLSQLDDAIRGARDYIMSRGPRADG